MEKDSSGKKKLVKLESAILTAFIALVVGFVGGIVFSAFKMEGSPAGTSFMVSSGESVMQEALTEDQTEEIAALEKAAAQDPENAERWISLGNKCFDLGQAEKAIHAYETALKLKPENADVWTDLGIMYRQVGEAERAVSAFEKAQEVSPGHEPSLLNAGIVLFHDLNDPAGALIAWEKLLEINPGAVTSGGIPIKDIVDALKSQQ